LYDKNILDVANIQFENLQSEYGISPELVDPPASQS